MKKILNTILIILAALYITPAVALIYSESLHHENVCNFTDSFPIQAGDKVHFSAYTKVGDLLRIEMKVTNPAQKTKHDRWSFVNHNKKRFTRKYSQTFTTKLRVGVKGGWFEFHYKRFTIPKGNIITFNITDLTYCRKPVSKPVSDADNEQHNITP